MSRRNRKISITLPQKDDFEWYREEAKGGEGWVLSQNVDGVKVWTRKEENSPLNQIKIQADFYCSPQLLYDLLSDDDYYLEKMTDELFVEWKCIEWIDKQNQISYCNHMLKFMSSCFQISSSVNLWSRFLKSQDISC